MIKASHCPRCVKGTSKNKKNFVGSLGFCSVHYNGMLNKMAAIANIGNLNFDEITL